ncbi:RcnB family protein [Luteibacter sp.]|uniref:RcnB family protein n=1 Tax=Luteibacter sp. TaxID=1886636 RepID=UPI0039C9509E
MLSKIALTVAASAIVAPAFAFSPAPFQPAGIQQYHDDHDNDHRDDHRDDRRDDRRDDHRDDHRDHRDYRDDRRDERADYWHPGPGRHWERGHRYDGRVIVVDDYRERHLREPPRGYRWQRADNDDFILVAIATGVIADIVSH